jgi:hypothetical protein
MGSSIFWEPIDKSSLVWQSFSLMHKFLHWCKLTHLLRIYIHHSWALEFVSVC